MNKNILIGAILASLMIVGCGSSNSDTTNDTPDRTIDDDMNVTSMDTNMTSSRFRSMTMNKQIIVIDAITKLEWINGASQEDISTGTENGCLPTGPGETEESAKAISSTHCDTLDFAGYTDWRVPTAEEHKVFIVEMKKADMTPFYTNPFCPRVAGTDADDLNTVNTHNTAPIGDINSWAEGNYGTRCVRTAN